MFRKLLAIEIKAKVKMITKNNAALVLLFKDARVDMGILDETVGMYNWNKAYFRDHKDNLFCTVGVREDATQDFVYKSDVGMESQADKAKGEASDAFKRACFNWGIGRELYAVPTIFIELNSGEVQMTSNNKKTTYTKFYVKEVEYDGNSISNVVLVDDKGKERYRGVAVQHEETEEEKAEDKKQKEIETHFRALLINHRQQFIELVLSDIRGMDKITQKAVYKSFKDGCSEENYMEKFHDFS